MPGGEAAMIKCSISVLRPQYPMKLFPLCDLMSGHAAAAAHYGSTHIEDCVHGKLLILW